MHATLDLEQLISCIRAALVDTLTCLQSSDGGDIATSDMNKLLTKIHDIMDSAVSKWIGNAAHTGGAGFYSNVFIVPKYNGGLQPILDLKLFNPYMYIAVFKIPTSSQVWKLIQQGVMLFLLISKMLIYIFLLLSIIIIFMVCLVTHSFQWKGFPYGIATAKGFHFTH